MEERYVICEGERRFFALPSGGKVLHNPTGLPCIGEIAKPVMDVALIFDGLRQPTPANPAMPEITNRPNKAAIPDSPITAGEVKMMKFAHAGTLPEARDMVAGIIHVADVAIFPSGGTAISGAEQVGKRW